MTTTLITGGAGFIGSHLANDLSRRGGAVCVFDNLTTGDKESLLESVAFVEGDIRDEIFLNKIIKSNAITNIIHLAGKLNVPESVQHPTEYYDVNVGGTLSLVKACEGTNVKNIIFSSSGSIYGSTGNSELLKETAPARPESPYAWSKLMAENILNDFGRVSGAQVVNLRYFVAAGAALDGSNGQRTRNANQLVQLAVQAACGKRDAITICGTDFPTADGTGVRDYIHIEDLVDIHMRALEYLQQGGVSQTLNCGYGRGYSVKEVIRTIKKISGVDFAVIEGPRRPGDSAALVADNSKVRQILNWKPKYDDIELICRSAYMWEKGR